MSAACSPNADQPVVTRLGPLGVEAHAVVGHRDDRPLAGRLLRQRDNNAVRTRVTLDVVQGLLDNAVHGLGGLVGHRRDRLVRAQARRDAAALAESPQHVVDGGTQARLAHAVVAHLADRRARLGEAARGRLLGAGQLGFELVGGQTAPQLSNHADLRQKRHQRMRQRVVQVAREAQALARDRRVARFAGHALDLRGTLGHARFELRIQRGKRGLLLLQVADELGDRGPEAPDLVEPRWHRHRRAQAVPHGLRVGVQCRKAPGQHAGDRERGQARHEPRKQHRAQHAGTQAARRGKRLRRGLSDDDGPGQAAGCAGVVVAADHVGAPLGQPAIRVECTPQPLRGPGEHQTVAVGQHQLQSTARVQRAEQSGLQALDPGPG
ncbi:MAG: hypothetical protein R3E41_06930 [Burkholderiaceae bacterium]